MVNYPTQIQDSNSHRPALLDLFISSDASICSTKAYPPLQNSDYVVVLVSIDFSSYLQQMPHFIALLMTILVLIGMVFMIVWEMMSLNSELLLLLVNFVSMFRLEMLYISLIESIRSSLTHLHGFQLLVLLP